jgi:DUF2971 family protein
MEAEHTEIEAETQLPPVLYKYRDWSDPNHKRIITHGEVYFASAESFNDPFDCTIDPHFDEIDPRRIRERAEASLKRDHPDWSQARITEEVERDDPVTRLRDPEHQRKFLSDFRERRRLNFGILSLSAQHLDNLMWSHYANDHKGFCVGFAGSELHRIIEPEMPSPWLHDNRFFHHKVIEYARHYPQWPVAQGPIDEEFIFKSITTKSSEWTYEKEHRIILHDDGRSEKLTPRQRRVPFPPRALSEIILGCEMPEVHREEIKRCLRYRGGGIDLFQAERDRSFRLKLTPVVEVL